MGQQIRFGGFTFEARTGALSRDGLPVPLQSQPARVLAVLVARAGVVVTRDELRREVWGETWVDFDQGLNFCIRQIRIALGDDARHPTFVQTLPNRGYRFLAAVTSPESPAPSADGEVRSWLGRRRLLRAAGAGAVATIAGMTLGLQSARYVIAEFGPSSNIQHVSAHLEPGDFIQGAWRHHLKPFFSGTSLKTGAPASERQSPPAIPGPPLPES